MEDSSQNTMNPARFRQTPSWAQNPVQHSNEHYRISDAQLQRKLAATDAKEKHHWSTPDWAVENNKVTNKAVDKSSIARPMLKTTNNASKLVAQNPTADPADLEALQRKLAQAKLDAAAAAAEQQVDPTANMTPEQKAKYVADARLEALRVQTEERELEAWKANQAERTAWEKQKRDEARQKAVAEQKAREQQEKAEREKQRAKLQAEQQAQQAKEADLAAAHQQATVSEVELLQQQIMAIQQQLEAAGGAPASPTPAVTTMAAVAPSPTPSPSAAPPIVINNNANNKHRWSKPGWALPDEVIAQEASIVSDSIQNGLKAPSTGGYERKVFAKELKPPIVEGKFVKPAAKAPPPRMVWTVLNINGIKRGKIVMHLYGNADAIVDKFLELKGLECKRTADNTVFCDELQPHFYFFGGKAAQVPTRQNPSAVYGVVLEGHDVLQLAQKAAPDAVISIRQSHIFPVKRAKS